jgi:hypothetical protein
MTFPQTLLSGKNSVGVGVAQVLSFGLLSTTAQAIRAAVSVSLRGKRSFSDVDFERARLLHQYALHRASADAQRLADPG